MTQSSSNDHKSEMRRWIISALGHKCTICGTDDDIGLEPVHVDEDGAPDRRSLQRQRFTGISNYYTAVYEDIQEHLRFGGVHGGPYRRSSARTTATCGYQLRCTSCRNEPSKERKN